MGKLADYLSTLAQVAATAAMTLVATASASLAETRLALVIGNSAYQRGALANPVNDAKLMTETLKGVGFEVITVLDADQKTMKRAMIDFGRKLRDTDSVGLFYYAGHGVQVAGENFLVPVNADIRDEADVPVEAIGANEFLRTMERAAARINIVILDACRDNPFASSSRSVSSRGLAIVDAPTGSFVAYATAPGDVALDGKNGNSPYALALSKAIASPGKSIEDVFKQTRREVLASTDNKQTPWDNSSLTGDFYFKPGPAEPGDNSGGSSSDPRLAELEAYDGIKGSSDIGELQAFVDQYPASSFADLVKDRIAKLKGDSTPAPIDTAEADVDPNSPDGIYRRGLALELGKGVVKDLFGAAELYAIGVEKGHTPSMVRYALLNLTGGEGIDKDEKQAFSLLRQAADKGDAGAMAELGNLYLAGRGVAKDADEALQLYKRSASLGSPLGANNLGKMYELGNGVAKNPAEAFVQYREAARGGLPEAMFNLAKMMEKGVGTTRDIGEAVQWYKLAAEKGHAPSASALGKLYEFGEGVDKDLAGAARSYQAAADAGDPAGLTSLAYLYEQGKGVDKDPEKAASLYAKAAEGGDPRAMFNLASMLHDGRGVSPDYAEAARLYGDAAALGHAAAMRGLAVLYEEGKGVGRNPKKAAEFLLKAYKAGHKDTRGELNQRGEPWSEATRREIQAILKKAGVYKGKVDGAFGTPTAAALKAWLVQL